MQMVNIYKYFGIRKNASKETIKKAYRKKSKEVHPDVGGSKEAFEECNLYYQVLMDSERRAQYDETGNIENVGVDNVEAGAMSVMLSHVMNILQRPIDIETHDLVEAVKFEIENDIFNLEQGIESIQAQIDLLEKVQKRMKRKKNKKHPNVINDFIDQQKQIFCDQMSQNKKRLKVAKKAYELVDEYEYMTDNSDSFTLQIDLPENFGKMFNEWKTR